SVLFFVVLALSSSLMPLIAKNLRAGQHQMEKQALLLSLNFIFVFHTLLYFPLEFLAEPLANLFSTDPLVLVWLSFYFVVLP
ncbi:MATE family efflux transporter, partial [Shewanella xiamenensis]|nr:MATE family efflux transporter [Shewanella xiamenensis]